ncbi:MAG: YetF domain-containing protein [Gemmatimonadaceae bacterium]
MAPPVIPHSPIFFDGWYSVGRTVSISIIGFVALISMLRISGKRTLSALNVFDFVFVVAVGSVFASMIMFQEVTFANGMAALISLISVQVGLAELAARWPLAERIINGEPTLLLSRGEFIPRALKRERVTEEEVRAAIRGKGITRVEDVDAVILENDGTLTVAWEAKGPGRSSLVDATVPGGTRSEENETPEEK